MFVKVGIGQDSHRFLEEGSSKQCVIGGLLFPEVPGMDADSDGDVVLHAICNAITSITHTPILGGVAIDLCQNQGVKDSALFLKEAMRSLEDYRIVHIALSIEAQKPRLQNRLDEMRLHIASLMQLNASQIGVTCTSGDGLSDFGKGLGLQCLCILTASTF